jgi:hypothetical protein
MVRTSKSVQEDTVELWREAGRVRKKRPEVKLVFDSNNHNVAVIDDDPAMLESLQFLLEAAGYTVGAYPSALEFLNDRAAVRLA